LVGRSSIELLSRVHFRNQPDEYGKEENCNRVGERRWLDGVRLVTRFTALDTDNLDTVGPFIR
jgi:hypothetical protein